jgi:hypothetical protein
LNQKNRLIRKLAALANEFDMLGDVKTADQVTAAMKSAADYNFGVVFPDEPGATAKDLPTPALAPLVPTSQSKEGIKELNKKVQEKLNALLNYYGKPTVRTDGIMDDASKKALKEYAGEFKTNYRTWKELFDHLDAEIRWAAAEDQRIELTEKDLADAEMEDALKEQNVQVPAGAGTNIQRRQ